MHVSNNLPVNKMKIIILLIVSGFGIPSSDTAKILLETLGKSHLNVFMPLIKELKARNHEVHIATARSLSKSFPPESGIEVIYIDELDMPPEMMKDFMFSSINKNSISKIKEVVTLFSEMMCKSIVTSDNFQKLLKMGKQYDLAIVDCMFSECATASTRLLANMTMYLCTGGLFQWKAESVPKPPSFVPDIMDPITSKMSFFQRMWNAYTYYAIRKIIFNEAFPIQQKVLNQHVPEAPTIEEAEKEVSFFLTNADPVIYSPRPSAPNVVDVGGMHCGKPKPLTQEFDEFANGAGEDGFIMFGLGSNARSDLLPLETIKALLEAFSRLKVKVLWKYESDFKEPTPPNVKISKWMPQQALLGHTKARLFMTHGGLLSLQEAIYHGVPVIGIPLFADQPGNVARIQELGIGEKLDILNVTADGVYQLINKILNDKSYSTNMKKYSAIFRDQPETPLQRAVFWTEYVIRHNGAHHLKSAAEDLNFFQYFLLDVAAFIITVLIVCSILLGFTVKFIFKMLCKSKQKKA